MKDIETLIAEARETAPERRYLDWLRTQPSALSGHFSWNDGAPFCEPAHWRTARYAGIATKPEYLAIPLTHDEHALQHRKGQNLIGSRDWWEEQCRTHLQRWLTA